MIEFDKKERSHPIKYLKDNNGLTDKYRRFVAIKTIQSDEHIDSLIYLYKLYVLCFYLVLVIPKIEGMH